MWSRLLDRTLRVLIRRGTLVLTTPDGRTRQHGTGNPRVAVTLHDPSLVRRLVLDPELALGEGYMDATLSIEGDDLHGLLALALDNLSAGNVTSMVRLRGRLRDLARRLAQFNPAGRSRRNVAHHYNLSGALYDLFLDADRQYSCAYFRSPDDSLEQAQSQKKAHIAAKLRLRPGLRVLDIGCGWGGLALSLARHHGVQVLGVTLSEEQLAIARSRARKSGLDGQVRFELADYRSLSEPFDRVVSVGMFEHVGAPHFATYFRQVHDLLAPDGVALIHTIGRMTPPGHTNPFIARHIFPGGYVPALSEMMAAIEPQGLATCDIEVWRLHYAMTLRHWHDRFMANRDRAEALYDARFVRMWRFYLVASEQAFRHGGLCVFQLQLSRDQRAVPLTRDYLYPAADPMQTAAQ